MQRNAANWSKHQLVVVFDGTKEECAAWGEFLKPGELPVDIIYWTGKQLGVGGAKNYGAERIISSDPTLKLDGILMFSDNDMYYLPDWDKRLEAGMGIKNIIELGGWKHPYHVGDWIFREDGFDCPDGYGCKIDSVDAVTGNCFVIRWADWLKYGPFDANAIGPGQSEDYAFSQKVKSGGGIVATLDPPVAIHVGLANCLGEPAVGWQEMSQMAEKQIQEYAIDKIWLSTPDEGTILLEKKKYINDGIITRKEISLAEAKILYPSRKLCLGSGQKRFDTSHGWINIDVQEVLPDRVPDIVCDFTKEPLPFNDNQVELIVAEHCIEHVGCGEATPMLNECWRVLEPGGSLIITTPDMKSLAGRWLGGELTTQIYMTNVYGAYMGNEADRHRWGGDFSSWTAYISEALPEAIINEFDWRPIPGANIAKDFWILGIEVTKN